MQYLPHHTRLQKIQPGDPGAFSGWRDYPVGVIECTTSARFQSDQLSRLGQDLFSEEIQVRLIDIRDDSGK